MVAANGKREVKPAGDQVRLERAKRTSRPLQAVFAVAVAHILKRFEPALEMSTLAEARN
jgi:hypothetical protein